MKYKTVKYRKGFSILLFLCIGLYLLTGCAKKEEKTKENILGTVKEFTGYQREIGQEEYEFYTYFIERENTEQLTAEEMEKKVRDYANEVNALFHLANKLQLCEPYSYETLIIIPAAFLGILGAWRHKSNIKKLMSGTENKIGEKK